MKIVKIMVLLAVFGVNGFEVALAGETVTISTQENKKFEVDLELAKLSGTLKDLVEDAGTEATIPLPGITNETWDFIQGQLQNVQDKKTEEIVNALIELSSEQLVAVINAANFLDVKLLLDEATKVAQEVGIDKITPAQIAQIAAKEIRNPLVFEVAEQLFGPITGKEFKKLEGHMAGVRSLVVLPDGSLASGSFDKTIRIWDSNTGEELKKLEGHTIFRSLVVLPNGNIASGSSDSFDKTIRIWDSNTGKELKKLEGHTGEVFSLVVLPNGNIVSGSSDTTIRIWEIDYGVSLLEQEFKKMLAKQASQVWELLRKLHDKKLAKAAAGAEIKKVLDVK